jgi:NTP pyrophosphatase (non-canonical NTP hydrolase)
MATGGVTMRVALSSHSIRLASKEIEQEETEKTEENNRKELLFFFLSVLSVTSCSSPSFQMKQSDNDTTVAELRKLIADFVAERDWSQFHSPKNVSMALAIEAAELMEHFQWLTTEASRQLASEPEKLVEVGEELADVIGYSFALANELGLDVSSAIRAKMVKNAEKYPAEKYRGRYERPKK